MLLWAAFGTLVALELVKRAARRRLKKRRTSFTSAFLHQGFVNQNRSGFNKHKTPDRFLPISLVPPQGRIAVALPPVPLRDKRFKSYNPAVFAGQRVAMATLVPSGWAARHSLAPKFVGENPQTDLVVHCTTKPPPPRRPVRLREVQLLHAHRRHPTSHRHRELSVHLRHQPLQTHRLARYTPPCPRSGLRGCPCPREGRRCPANRHRLQPPGCQPDAPAHPHHRGRPVRRLRPRSQSASAHTRGCRGKHSVLPSNNPGWAATNVAPKFWCTAPKPS